MVKRISAGADNCYRKTDRGPSEIRGADVRLLGVSRGPASVG